TADKLVANSITAGQIAAGAITSEQIAAGTIIAKNLVVADASAADPDPSFYDPTFWFPVTGWPANIQPQAHSSYPVPRILHFASTGYIESLSRNFVVEEGAQYRLRVWMFKSSGIVGNFGVAMHVPGVIYSAMGIPRKASSVTGFAGDIDWNAVPSDAWVHYDTVLTGPALKFFQYVIYGSLPSADLYIGFQLTRMASANLIVDGSITTYKIAAGSITADRIAALTITGDKIAANQITTEKIEAGAVTAAKIAAGSITADKIVGGTITGDKIAANTITADRLAANSITANQLAAGSVTAGKIAAGAVSATEIASGAITTDKLAVISRGSAINANPECSDATAWGSLDGVTIAGLGVNGASGTSAFVSNATTNSCTVTSKIFPLSVGKTYRVSAWIRTANGNGTPNSAYLRCFRMNGAAVDIAYNTQLEGFTVNEFFTNVTGTFVAEANTTQGLLRAYLNWGSPAAGAVTWLQDFRIEEVLPGTLIKDGAITTQKIAAATITGDKIAANTITADRIVVNSLTSDQMAVNSVHANRLIAGSITGDKIAANSIQADRVQAGTFQTSASGRRTEISGVTNTLKSYASNGTVIAQIGEGTPGSGFMELNGSADTSRYTLYSYGSFLIATGQINIVSPIGGANGTAIMAAGQVYAGDLIPHNGNSYNVGLPGIPWAGIYSRTAVVIVSDAREKYDVEDISVGLGFIEQLRPVSYRVLHGTSTTVDGPIQEGPVRIGDKPLGNSSIRTVTKGVRKHYGFVAQEVKKAMGEEDVGLWTLGDTDNPDSIQALRYEELIAPLVRAVQELSSTIRTMQEEILELTEQLKGKS
ncbi:MAG: tail fiber domain-containing protein, partial [Citrobacter sp.]